jgi:hypothetical protein
MWVLGDVLRVILGAMVVLWEVLREFGRVVLLSCSSEASWGTVGVLDGSGVGDD